jgi:hypothetical protein
LIGKVIYRDICDAKLQWDEDLPNDLRKRWQIWYGNLPAKVEVPRSLTSHKENIQAVDLHSFGDTSGRGTSAAVYAVVYQDSGVSQGLVSSKSRLPMKGQTIPRLELVAGHLAANLTDNVKKAMQGLPVRHCYGWQDSTVALYWIKGRGNYKQFVSNRVRLIKEKSYIEWRHVGKKEKPADIGSRGCYGNKLPVVWLSGACWLAEPSEWPEDKTITSSKESEAEEKPVKDESLKSATEKSEDVFDKILAKHSFWKTMRITAWIARFSQNSNNRSANKDR